jgi:hypothetical protein
VRKNLSNRYNWIQIKNNQAHVQALKGLRANLLIKSILDATYLLRIFARKQRKTKLWPGKRWRERSGYSPGEGAVAVNLCLMQWKKISPAEQILNLYWPRQDPIHPEHFGAFRSKFN